MGVPSALIRGHQDAPGESVLQVNQSHPNSAQRLTHTSIGPYKAPTWTTPLFVILITSFLIPNTSLIGHLCGAAIGYLWGMNYIKFLAPPEKILRWLERKLDLLARLPHYVSVDKSTFGRYGVLPSSMPLQNMPAGSSQKLGA